MESGRTTQVLLSLDCYQLELEHLPVAVVLLPRVHEMEDAVVGPYAFAQLLVHAHPLGRSPPVLVILSRLEEPTVLGKSAVSGSVWLIDGFGLRNRIAPWLVVALVDEGGSIIFESVLVRCAGPDGHE
jgi:hypothetical protein